MKEPLSLLQDRSPVRRYLKWIEECGNDELYEKKYRPIVALQDQGSVFLTVVIRTQCKRREMLQDVLLCLEAQTDPDFEVVLVCHKASEEDFRSLGELIQQQPEELVQKTRVIRTEEGERGAPANLGFAYARGNYAVCLDDDDLVLDRWVQVFHEAAGDHDGMILHAGVLTQEWQVLPDRGDGCRRLTATGGLNTQYCIPYGTLAQVYENYCPFMGVAFPLYLFREMHVLLDETIRTTEDWDYLLRTAGIAGVFDVGETTAIYRQWNTKDTSHTVAGFHEWEDNYRIIAEGNMRYPILLNEEEAELCKRDLVGKQASGKKGRSCFMKDAVLFWSNDESFSDERHLRVPVILKDDWMQADFHLEERRGIQTACRIRIDPSDDAFFCLDSLQLLIHDRKGNVQSYTLKDVRETNAIVEGDRAFFLSYDPRMVIPLRETTEIFRASFRAHVSYECPESFVQRMSASLELLSRLENEKSEKNPIKRIYRKLNNRDYF